MPPRSLVSLAGRALPLGLLALAAACADAPTRPDAAPAPPRAPALAIVDATRGGPDGFHWLAPTVPTQPATFPAPFDAAALAELAVEVCALDAAESACAGAPVARYTAQTQPYAQQLRADAAREFFLVYWNTAASNTGGAATRAGTVYRARVLRGAGAEAAELGHVDVRVATTSTGLSTIDRSRYTGVVLGQQLALRFRVGVAASDAATSVSADVVRAVAAQIQDALAAGEDVTPAVRDVLGAFMPLLDAGQQAEAEQLLARGWPAAYGFQASLIARGLRDGRTGTVENFVEAAAAAGATTPAGALTRAYLTDRLRPLAGRASYGADEVVPALVLALGQARAQRTGAPADPVWGDGQLDALQTTLLLYAFHFAGDDAAGAPVRLDDAPTVAAVVRPAVARPALARAGTLAAANSLPFPVKLPKFISPGKMVMNWKVGAIGSAIGMPLTWAQAVQAAPCASILLYSYRFSVEATPTQIARAGMDLPTSSEIRATLVFDFVPDAWAAWALQKTGCTLPANGPAAGKTVRWTVNQPLLKHGTLISQTNATDAAGRAAATYATVANDIPTELRSLVKEDNGNVDVRATGLVPQWQKLEQSVGVGHHNPTDAGVRLFVKYHDWPQALEVTYSAAFDAKMFERDDPGKLSGAMSGRIVLEKQVHDGGKITYWGVAPMRYDRFSYVQGTPDCGLVSTATRAGQYGMLFSTEHPHAPGRFAAVLMTTYPYWPSERYWGHCGPNDPGTHLDQHFLAATVNIAHYSAPLYGWTTTQQGTSQLVVDRGVTAKRLPGGQDPKTFLEPIRERATYTLRVLTP